MKIRQRIFQPIQFAIIFLFPWANGCFSQTEQAITVADITKHVSFLASDSLAGRGSGTHGDTLAAFYIRETFRNNLLGGGSADFLQPFAAVADAEAGEGNYLSANSLTAKPGKDFLPLSFSANMAYSGPLAIVGFGLQNESEKFVWNSYDNINVTGKWVMIFRGNPVSSDTTFGIAESERMKALLAREKGAMGVLFVSTTSYSKDDELIPVHIGKRQSDISIPAFSVSRDWANQVLKPEGYTVDEIEASIRNIHSPKSILPTITINGSAQVKRKEFKTFNVFGIVEGSDPDYRNEYIVIGAHYDHLGMGGQGSGSRMPDTVAVHNGADDNASGVAGMLEIAEYFAKSEQKPLRSLIFVAFGGEESGLLGSAHFVNHCPIDTSKIVAMINLDMIGRMKKDSKVLSIGGTGTALESEEILNMTIPGFSFKLAFDKAGYGPSDHASFYGINKPVFFVTTGVHTDYHTPFDDIDSLDIPAEVEVCKFVELLTAKIAGSPDRLTFREAGPKASTGGRRSFKVTLGIMPDHAATDTKGLGVAGVREGGPAQLGGIKKGDVIKGMGGIPITNIYDYMFQLGKLKSGQTINVEVLRNGKTEVLLIQL
ncbi:MAG: M20/M25/M40 family metallo-hydrolase [Bacteroidetes bacterium]|nr:M20/M25/M40 family metallo-hydrolase [Bacteroidota bacterium]MBU1719265.1 M20/M25/M40 family metallo-hydrolase [Bacteroidota bacterium]